MSLSRYATPTNVFFALMVIANSINITCSPLYKVDEIAFIMILRFTFLIVVKASLYAGFPNVSVPYMVITLFCRDPAVFAGHFIPFSSYPYALVFSH